MRRCLHMDKMLLTEMKIRCETAHMEQPLDIRRILAHNKEIGRNFTAVIFAMGDTNNVTYFLNTMQAIAKSGQGDLDTLKDLAVEQLCFYGYRYLNYYAMNDMHTIFLRFAFAAKDAETLEELAEYLRVLQIYTGQMSYWIDLAFPWSPVTEKYNAMMA